MEQGAKAPHVRAGFGIEGLNEIRVPLLHRSGRVSGAAAVITSDAG